MKGSPVRKAGDEARLRHRVRRLRAVVDASLLVNSELDLERLAQHVVAVAVRLIGAERGSLFLLDAGGGTLTSLVAQGLPAGAISVGTGEGIVGTVAAKGRALLLHDPYTDPRFDPAVDRATGFRTRSLLTVPVRDREGTLVAVLQLLNKRRGGFGREDVTFLGELGATFALALTTAKLHREIVARERTAEEMKLAAQIQRTLQPEDLSVVPGLEVRALFRPSYEVGGDYFDCIPTAQGKWWLVLADVSGKGVSSALIASNVQAYLWSRRNDGAPLEAVAAEGNELLHLLAKGRKYATLVLAEWTPESRELRWVNAGHPPAMLRHGGRVERLGATGVPMGLLPGMPYGAGRCTLAPGDVLLAFTDGVSEAGEGTKAGDFGLDRVERIVRGLRTGGDLNAAVASAVDKHLRGEPAGDDITLLCARVLEARRSEP
jgi:phosphoserine phosphatase RsbU/P